MKNISFYKNAFDASSTITVLDEILVCIQNGTYKRQILKLRQFYGENRDEYTKLKSQLPAVTFSGVFGERRKEQFLQAYSGVIVFDIDKLEDANTVYNELSKDPLVYSAWISPSNSGIKFLVLTTATAIEHKLFFQTLRQHFEKSYNIQVDKSGSDITRLCYVSFDENLRINKQSQIVTRDFIDENAFSKDIGFSIKQLKAERPSTDKQIDSSHNRGKGKNNPQHRELIKRIIRYLSSQNKSITSTYDSWYRVAYAIANTFSYDVGLKYYLELCRLDKGLHDEVKSTKMLQYCYDHKINNLIKFSTIVFLAGEVGFNIIK